MTNSAASLDRSLARSYVDDGFVVVPGLLGREEVEEVKEDIVRLARGAYPCPGIEPWTRAVPTTTS